jgi:hypothetical membrane protein
MTQKNWGKKAFLFELIGGIQYIVLIFIAMLFYMGGTADDPKVLGYSFWGNSLSDLGRTVAYSGRVNTISMIIFSITLIIWAISIIPFFMALRFSFLQDKLQKQLTFIGLIFAIITGISLIGIAFTPDDILDDFHMIFVYIGYTSLFIAGLLFSIAMYLNKGFPRIFMYLFIIFTAVHFITSMMGLVGLASALTLMVIGQKIGRYTTVICFAIVSYGMWKK